MVNENIVRDRTLVLRVLVPGLHTQLSDKLLAKQEAADRDPTVPATGPSQNDHILNLEGVTCLPSSGGDSTLWHFRCDGATYPARLVNLPCPVEIHKTHDHATYHKSADIGQMLIVYEDEYAMEEAENEKGYKIEGFPSYFHSGLSPPMKRVVQRRFRARFEERESKPIPPPPKEVSEVERGIQELIAKLSAKPGKQKKGGGSSAATSSSSAGTVITTKEKVIEEVEDEIVDYEPWMGEGGIIYTVEDAKKHPEWWLTKEEMKEIEIAKKAEEDEMLRKMEKAEERKKRKKEKKQKKMEGSAAAEASLAPSESSVGLITKNKKKGIPSIKSRPLHPSSSVPQEEPQPIDDVEEAARALTSAEGGDDFLFELENDDMFDFDNEDITSLI